MQHRSPWGGVNVETKLTEIETKITNIQNIGKVCSALYKPSEDLYDISFPAKIPCTVKNINNADGLLQITNDGCIKVVSDKVKTLLLTSGALSYQPSTDTYFWTRIVHHNVAGADNYVGYSLASNKSGWSSANIPAVPASVSKGDYFYLHCLSDGVFKVRGGSNTHLTAIIIE